MGKGQSEARILAQMTKRSVSIEVGDKKYKLAPLELKQLTLMDQWAAKQAFARLQDISGVIELTEKQKDRLVDKAYADSSDAFTRGQEIGSLPGMMKAVQLSFSIHHPDMTDEEFDKIMSAYPLEKLAELLQQMSEIKSEGKEGDEKK